MTGTRTDGLIAAMTLAEKCAMVSGADAMSGAGVARLGIPGWKVSDGPVGARGSVGLEGLLLPSPTAQAATWDPELVEELGAALGDECNDREIDMLLAPTVNLHRSPRGGRHFECFSEDPELSARIAVAFVRGLQSRRVGACIKHFVANDQEHERHTVDVHVDDRTLREVYLRPFEAAVAEAGVRGVMAAYNTVNGEQCCASPTLLLDVLRREWGFTGLVMSDWGAAKETVGPARFGLDLEMPGPGVWWGGGRLQAAVESGEVAEADLDAKVRRILGFLEWRGRLDRDTTTGEERAHDTPCKRALVRRAAAESMVLVRNRDLLPLDPSASLALIGPGAAETTLFGGGSSMLRTYPTRSLAEAVAEQWSGPVTTAPGVSLRRVAPTVDPDLIPGGVTVALHDGTDFTGEPVRVERHEGAFHVWYGDRVPPDADRISVRMTFALVPQRTGRYRIVGSGFRHTTLAVDGTVLTDNTDGFKVALGLVGAAVEIDLEAGRAYEVVLEHFAPEGRDTLAAVVDVGLEEVASPTGDPFADAVAAAAAADVAVVVVGTNAEWETEGLDRSSLNLPRDQDDLVRRVAAVNRRTVVVLNCGAPVELPWLDDVAAVVIAWFPGLEGSDAILDVLTGVAEPAGRMPTTWAADERDTPSYLHYPGEAGVVRYGEERFVGHRWYEARGITPMLAFGEGGSYTEFVWATPTVRTEGTDVVIEVPVTNVGARAGSDVVQVYVAMSDRSRERRLAGFAKLRLDPGATGTARVVVPEITLARWDVADHDWVVDPGTYDLVVAASAVDERFRIPHVVAEPS